VRALKALTVLIGVLVGLIALIGCSAEQAPAQAGSSGATRVELIYLDHPPVRQVLTDIDAVLAKYASKLEVKRLDAESEQGKDLAEANGLTGHLALAVIIDGVVETELDGRKIRFEGFPEGRAPIASAQGSWKIDDLDAVLARQVASR